MTYSKSSITIIQRVTKSDDAPYGASVIKSLPIDKPVFAVFGGELTNDLRGANSYAKRLQILLYENNIPDVGVYSVAYQFGSRNPVAERVALFRTARRRIENSDSPIARDKNAKILDNMQQNEPTPQYIKQLFDILVRPRIVDNAGKPFDMATAVKNMSRMKIYAHCHGAAVAWQLANYMYDEMQKLGFDEQNIKKIQSAVLVIQHSPIAPMVNQRFFTISFASAEDSMMAHHNNYMSDWMGENSGDVVPAFFDSKYGNLFIAGRLKERAFKEHDYIGLLPFDEEIWPLTDDGKIIFTAERNAIVRAAEDAKRSVTTYSVRDLTNGNGVDFDTLKHSGDMLYKMMINDLHRQIPKPGRQK